MTDQVHLQSQPAADAPSDSFSAKVSRELNLWSGVGPYIGNGVMNRLTEMAQNKLLTGAEIGTAFTLAAGLTALSKMDGPVGTVASFAPKALLLLTGVDLGHRMAGPMIDLWSHKNNLVSDRTWLGNNLGAAAIDYPLVAISGFAGDTAASLALKDRSTEALNEFLPSKKTPKQIATEHASKAGKHLTDAPIVVGATTLENAMHPFQGFVPNFPHDLTPAKVGTYNQLKLNDTTNVIPSGGYSLDAKNETASFGIDVQQGGPVRLDLTASAPATDWGKTNAQSATMSVYVDGKYQSDTVLWDGSNKHSYAVSIGDLPPGKHKITLRYAPEKSTRGASGINVSSGTAEAVAFSNPIQKAIFENTPVLYGRHGLENTYNDTPLGCFYYTNKNADGSTTISYGIAFSNEDGGNGSEPSREQALWGRLTDLQPVMQVVVDSSGKRISSTYVGAEGTMKFNGKYDGSHPIIETATMDNDVSPTINAPALRFTLPPDYPLANNQPDSDLMRTNPEWWSVMEKELYRERKIDTNGGTDTPSNSAISSLEDFFRQYWLGEHSRMADPRNYLYVQFDANNTQNGPIAAEVDLKNGQKYYSDLGHSDVAVKVNAWGQTGVWLPPGTTAGDIKSVGFVSRGKGQGRVSAVGHVFMLNQNNTPIEINPNLVKTLGQ